MTVASTLLRAAVRSLAVFTLWQRHVAECNVLARLDDRALRDVGLTREGVRDPDRKREPSQPHWRCDLTF